MLREVREFFHSVWTWIRICLIRPESRPPQRGDFDNVGPPSVADINGPVYVPDLWRKPKPRTPPEND